MEYRKRNTKEARIKARFQILPSPKVEVCLFGSSTRYQFEISNFSESGVLLTCIDKIFTFNNLSILEVWIYPTKIENIYFSAKFVRRVTEKDMAVKIIDINPKNADLYQDLIDSGVLFED